MLPPLDPSIAPIIDILPDLTVSAETLVAMRELTTAMGASDALDDVERVDRAVDDTGITVRIHATSGSTGPRPCVFYMHGGGYVIGDRTMDSARLDAWASRLGCVVVSVEYRSAPEHPYPAALDDCYAALQWVARNADELGVDPEAIGIAGLSAGGGLTAALALLARDRAEMSVRFQFLDSPMLDDRRQTPSSQEADIPVWSRASNEYGWRSYLGARYGTDDVPAWAAPARAEDLSHLPPTFVAVGAVDGFRDEDIDYATRLSQAGVPTELHVYPGVPHGFAMFGDVPAARQLTRDAETWLARQFGIDLPEAIPSS